MSIYNKTWNVDEEITSDSLNRMASDITNDSDDIHSQYLLPGTKFSGMECGKVYGGLQHDGDGATIGSRVGSGDEANFLVCDNARITDESDIVTLKGGKLFSFKKLPGSGRYLHIAYDDYGFFSDHAIASVAGKSYYKALNNGAALSSGNFATSTTGGTNSRAVSIDMNAVADNNAISVEVHCAIITLDDTHGGGPRWNDGTVKISNLIAYVDNNP